MSQDFKMQSLATDGELLWGLDEDGRVRRHVQENTWEDQGGRLRQLSICKSGSCLWGIDQHNRPVYSSLCTDSMWKYLPRNHVTRSLAVACSEHLVYCTDSKVLTYVCSCCGRELGTFRSRLAQVSTSSCGSHVVGVNCAGDACKTYEEVGGEWKEQRPPKPLEQVALSGDGQHIWAVDVECGVYYKSWPWDKWARIPGKLRHVCVSGSGTQVWGICPEGLVWTFKSW